MVALKGKEGRKAILPNFLGQLWGRGSCGLEEQSPFLFLWALMSLSIQLETSEGKFTAQT